MSQHSPEPWTIASDYGYTVRDSLKRRLASSTTAGTPSQHVSFSDSDIERIVACVNACRGIPTEALTPDSVLDALNGMGDKLREGVPLPGRYVMHLSMPPAEAGSQFDSICREMRSRIYDLTETSGRVHIGISVKESR